MFNALNAGRQRATDGGRRISMDGDIGIPVGGGFDPGSHLGFGERQHVERRARRGDAAAAHELDLGGALQKLLAHPQAHLIRAVGDIRGALLLEKAERPAGKARQVRERTQVAMPAGGGDHRAAGVDARPRSKPVVDRLLEREGRSSEIANRGEAAHERAFGLRRGGEEDVSDIGGKQARNAEPGKDRVPMRVDQAGHDSPAAAVDDPRAFRSADFARARSP